jgi:hypothetical protein
MTRASDTRPTRRLLAGAFGDYVVELTGRTIVVRPKGTRRGGPAEVVTTPGKLHVRLVAERVAEQLAAKRKARRAKGGRR